MWAGSQLMYTWCCASALTRMIFTFVVFPPVHTSFTSSHFPPDLQKSKYKVKQSSQLQSSFLKGQAALATAAAAAAAAERRDTSDKADQQQQQGEEAEEEDGEGEGGGRGGGGTRAAAPICRTVHAWVLVMTGKRDVTEAVFIEPTTGRRCGERGDVWRRFIRVGAAIVCKRFQRGPHEPAFVSSPCFPHLAVCTRTALKCALTFLPLQVTPM